MKKTNENWKTKENGKERNTESFLVLSEKFVIFFTVKSLLYTINIKNLSLIDQKKNSRLSHPHCAVDIDLFCVGECTLAGVYIRAKEI